ncbi:TonB-dependent receptor [Chryseobacterium sp. CT-SW4]|uniref:TonB-dependent receptor n=1 Tax=Chryseobacterium sp. SW-1 TaxID=3157343 RepID=UPI003B02DAAC
MGNINYFLMAVSFSPAVYFAQEKNDSIKSNNLDEVIITATRSPEMLTKSTSTVSVINRKQIAEQSMISPDLSNILANAVPGMAFGNNQMGNRGQTLRGRDVLVMIDGIPQSSPLRKTDRNIRTIDPAVIERIEVVKGATSIYGNGAEGGIINYITKQNSSNKRISGNTTFSFTSHDLFNNKMFKSEGGAGYRVSQSLYGKLSKWDYFVNYDFTRNGVRLDGDGLVQNPRYGLGETNINNAFAKIGYNINQDSRLEVMYNYFSSLQDSKYILDKGKYGETPSLGMLGDRTGVKEGTRYNHNGYFSYKNKNIFRNTSLNTSLYFQDLYTIYDYREPPRWKTGGQSTITEKKYGFRTDFTTLFKEGNTSVMSLTYGVDALKENTSQPLVDGRVWVPELELLSFAPFVQSKIFITDDLTMKAGVRWDWIQVSVPDYTTLPSGKGVPYDVEGGKLKYTNWSYNVGLNYHLADPLQIYTSYSRGFSIYDLGRTLRDAKSNVLSEIETKPVVVDSYEIGINSKISDWLNLSASYFYNYTQLGTELVPLNGFWTVDRTPQYVQGVEITADVFPLKGLNIGGAYTYQEGKKYEEDGKKYLNGTSIAAPRLNTYVKYDSNKLHLGVYYLQSFERDRFEPNATTGKYEEGQGPVRSFGLFNFEGSYKINKTLKVGLGIENVLNKTYYTPTSMFTVRDAEYVRGNGRYYTVSLSFSY